jgi:hypothetical protein
MFTQRDSRKLKTDRSVSCAFASIVEVPLGATPCCCHHTFHAAGTCGYKQTTVAQYLNAPIRRPKMADHQITDGLTNKRRLAAEDKKPAVGSQCSRSERTMLGLANCDDATRIRPRLPGRTPFVRPSSNSRRAEYRFEGGGTSSLMHSISSAPRPTGEPILAGLAS